MFFAFVSRHRELARFGSFCVVGDRRGCGRACHPTGFRRRRPGSLHVQSPAAVRQRQRPGVAKYSRSFPRLARRHGWHRRPLPDELLPQSGDYSSPDGIRTPDCLVWKRDFSVHRLFHPYGNRADNLHVARFAKHHRGRTRGAGVHSDRRTYRADFSPPPRLRRRSLHRLRPVALVRAFPRLLFQPGGGLWHRDPQNHGGRFFLPAGPVLYASHRLPLNPLRLGLVAGLCCF